MWHLESKSDLPLYGQIIQLIERKIENGELLPGEKLPAERKLAQLLGVNRSTIVRALDELAASGKLVRTQGSGTHVNEEKWGVLTTGKTNWRHYVDQGGFHAEDPYIRDVHALALHDSKQAIDLATGELPVELMPQIETPSLSWQSFLAEESQHDILGYSPLRHTIQKQMAAAAGIKTNADQILITSGAQQAIFLITQCLLAPGDAIAIESPSYFYSLSLFQSAGLRIFALPMDEDGVIISDLEKLYRKHRIKMVFVNPTFQNPTGLLMPDKRRAQLIECCAALKIPIVEDDPFGPLLDYSDQAVTPLKKLDPDNVLYIGSLSKVMGSNTRIGWLDGPPAVVNRLAEARQEMDFGLSIFPQILANYVLQTDSFQQHLDFLRIELLKRRDLLIAALERHLPGKLDYLVPKGGFHLYVKLPVATMRKSLFPFFLDKKLLVMPSTTFGEKAPAVRLTFARITEKTAEQAAVILKDILDSN